MQGGSRGPIPNKDDERPLLFRPILLHNVARIVYLVVVQLCACRRLSPRLVLFLELAQDLGVEPFNGRMLALELRVQDAALVAALVEQLAATVPGLQIGIPSWAQQAPVWAYSASLRRWDLL